MSQMASPGPVAKCNLAHELRPNPVRLANDPFCPPQVAEGRFLLCQLVQLLAQVPQQPVRKACSDFTRINQLRAAVVITQQQRTKPTSNPRIRKTSNHELGALHALDLQP